jgi:hypothetical protein
MDNILMMQTTGATSGAPTRLTIGGGTYNYGVNTLSFSENGVWNYKIKIAGVRTDATDQGDCLVMEINGGLRNLSGVQASVGAPITVSSLSIGTGSTWVVTPVVGGLGLGLDIDVTGTTGATINWTAKVEIVQVRF